jgi:FG-GAP repeat protein
MRRTHLLFTCFVLFFLPTLCFAGTDKLPSTVSDLPPDAQAGIRAALAHSVASAPSILRGPGVVPPPTEGPWAQLTQPIATLDQGYYFGTSVAMSGDTIVIGQLYTFNNIGVAFVFVRPKTGDWNNLTQAAVLLPSDGLATDLFGSSVAISGGTIVVGSPPYAGCTTCGPGRAYVYVKPPGGWSGQLTQTAELTASDGTDGSSVGSSVSIAGDTVVAGAPGEMPGAAYVFVKPSDGWVNMTQTAKLTASDGAPGDGFGTSVSISGGTIVAGSPLAAGINAQTGAAYVFTEPAGGWTNMTQTAKLTASDGYSFDQLGLAVAVNGNTVAAGAPYALGKAANAGAAYLYTQPAGGWKNETQTAKLVAPDGETGDALGSAIAISNSTLVAGAPDRICRLIRALGYAAGGAYVFTESGSTWTQSTVQVLTGSDAHNADLLGASVAISGDFVVTGAPYLGKYLGAAFVFVRF